MLVALLAAYLALKLYPWGISLLAILPLVTKGHRWIACLTLVSVLLAYGSIWMSAHLDGQTISGSVVIDADGRGYLGLVPVCSSKIGVVTGSFDVNWSKYRCAVPRDVRVRSTPLESLRMYMIRNISKLNSNSVVAALVMGEKLPLRVEEQAVKSGVLHIFAVSGLQTTLLLSYLLRISHSKALVAACGLALLFVYGFMPSVIRSVLMYSVMLTLPRGRTLTLNGVAAVGLIASLVDPLFLTRTASILSLIGAGAVVYWGNSKWSQVKAGFTLLPVSLFFFHSFSLLGVPLSVVLVPLFTILYALGLIYALLPLRLIGLAVDSIGTALLNGGIVLEQLPTWVSVNMSSVEITVLLLGIVLAWQLRSKMVLVGAMAILLLLPPRDRVVFIDVGQGSATLVQHGSSAILVDTSNKSAVLRAIRWYGVRHLAVVISHHDADHDGMLPQVKASFNPSILEPVQGDAVSFRGTDLQVIWPPKGFIGTDNETSRVIYVKRFRGLITGDIPGDYLPAGTYYFVTVPHHGALLHNVSLNASLAIISVGTNNYGHPRQETIQLLEAKGMRVLRTDLCGDIVLDDLGIKCSRGLAKRTLGIRF